MARSLGAAAAGLLTVVLCLGTSTGPVLAEPTPTGTTPTGTTPPEPSPPSTSAPATTPTTAEPSPAPFAPAVELADLRLRVWFEKPFYEAREPITAYASVTNGGTGTANGVVVTSTGNMTNDIWSPHFPLGVTVEPGETIERTLTGLVATTENEARLAVTTAQLGGEPDANPDDNTSFAAVPIVLARGIYRGTLFGDRDGDGAQDSGEALAGVSLVLRGGRPSVERTEITGVDGTFVFRDLPVGEYYTYAQVTGWYLPTKFVDVRGPDDPADLIRAVAEVTGRLTASLAFSQESYREGDTAIADLALTNTGPVLLSDLAADCWLPYLHPDRPDVGRLTPGGTGVTLPAGARSHHPVLVPITERALLVGHVRLQCAVGGPPHLNGPITTFEAVARVPGGTAPRVTGSVTVVKGQNPTEPPWGDPLPGTKVYLRDAISAAVITRVVTDADGRFTFLDVPAGLYDFGLVGPWQLYRPERVVVRGEENGYPAHPIYVVPGPYQPDPDPVPPGGGAPPDVEPPDGTPDLAATGTDAARLALSGLLTLLAGTGLVLIARRGPNGPGSRRT